MAKPIKETPVLEGKDAKAFLQKMEEAKSVKLTKEEETKIRENFSKLSSIAQF